MGRCRSNEKAELWPRKLLHDFFIANTALPKNEVLDVVMEGYHEMVGAAKRLNFFCEDMKLDEYAGGKRSVVVGRDADLVRAKLAAISQERQRERVRARQEKDKDMERKFAQAGTLKRKNKEDAGQHWDVRGTWSIICPQDQWGGQNEEQCGLEIMFTRPTSTGAVQIFALFEFMVIEGIMRFVNPDPITASTSRSSRGLVESNDEDREDDEDESPAQYLLAASALLSSKNRDFKYRWRGEETGEGETQLYSDEKLCSISFESPNTLRGVFHSDLVDADFRGFKTDIDGGSSTHAPVPGYLWSQRGGAAYEKARIGRWH